MREGGRIVNISSGSARYASPEVISYAMTKGAIEVFTRTLAADIGKRGITVNAVAPAALDTDMNAHWLRGNDQAHTAAAAATALRTRDRRRHRRHRGISRQRCRRCHHRSSHRRHQRQPLVTMPGFSDGFGQ